jgi:hypothetical protein
MVITLVPQFRVSTFERGVGVNETNQPTNQPTNQLYQAVSGPLPGNICSMKINAKLMENTTAGTANGTCQNNKRPYWPRMWPVESSYSLAVLLPHISLEDLTRMDAEKLGKSKESETLEIISWVYSLQDY